MRRSIYLLYTKQKFIIWDWHYFPWLLVLSLLSHTLALADQELFSSTCLDPKHVQGRNTSLSDGTLCTQATALSAQMQLCFPLTFPHWNQVLRATLNANISLKRIEFWWKKNGPSGRSNKCLSVLPWCISVQCWVLYHITILLLETISSGRCKHMYFRREAQWGGVPHGWRVLGPSGPCFGLMLCQTPVPCPTSISSPPSAQHLQLRPECGLCSVLLNSIH